MSHDESFIFYSKRSIAFRWDEQCCSCEYPQVNNFILYYDGTKLPISYVYRTDLYRWRTINNRLCNDCLRITCFAYHKSITKVVIDAVRKIQRWWKKQNHSEKWYKYITIE
jgi:hypothetical protein